MAGPFSNVKAVASQLMMMMMWGWPGAMMTVALKACWAVTAA